MYLVIVELICYYLYSWSMCDICAKNGRKNLRRCFRKYICCRGIEDVKGERQGKCKHGRKRYVPESMFQEDMEIHSPKKPSSLCSVASELGNINMEEIRANKHLKIEVSHHASCPELNSKSLTTISMSSLLMKTIGRSTSEQCVNRYNDKMQLWSSDETIVSFKTFAKKNEFLIKTKDIDEFAIGDRNRSKVNQTEVDADNDSKVKENVAEVPITVKYESNFSEGDRNRNQDSCELFRRDIFNSQYLKDRSENKTKEGERTQTVQNDPFIREPSNSLSRVIQVKELHSEVNWLSNQGEKIFKKFQKLQDSLSQVDNLLVKVERNWTSICNKHRRFARNSVLMECRSKVALRKENQLMVKSNLVTQLADSEISLALEEQRLWMTLTKSVGELEAVFRRKPKEKPSIKRAQSDTDIEKLVLTNANCGKFSTRSLADERKYKDFRWNSLDSVSISKEKTTLNTVHNEPNNERRPINWMANSVKTNFTPSNDQHTQRKLITWKEIYYQNKKMNA